MRPEQVCFDRFDFEIERRILRGTSKRFDRVLWRERRKPFEPVEQREIDSFLITPPRGGTELVKGPSLGGEVGISPRVQAMPDYAHCRRYVVGSEAEHEQGAE